MEAQQEWKFNVFLVLFVTRILYYNNKDAVKYIYWFYYWKKGSLRYPLADPQEYCWEVKADKNGKVITNGEY